MKIGIHASAVIFVLTALALEAMPRVALMDFSIDDNSYRSAQLAADFSAILQVKLTGQTNVEWVERAQLEKARQELELSAADLVSGGANVRRGKWVKADWMITGQFSLDDRSQRTLFVAVTDLDRADVLASRTMVFPGVAAPQFQLDTNQIGAAAETARRLLSDAIQHRKQMAERILVAPLFFAEVTGFGGDFGFFREPISLEHNFLEAFERATATNQRIQLIRFPKAYRSADEAEMVLGGLTVVGDNSWQQMADLYVWGTFAATRKFMPGKPPEEEMEIHLHLWDGALPPIDVRHELPVAPQAAQLQNAIEDLIQRVIANSHKRAAEIDSSAIRRDIARSLVETYDQMSDKTELTLALNDPDKFLQVVHMLETACFFDPTNAGAQQRRISCRWGFNLNFPASSGFHGGAKSEFWSKWRASEAWGKYVNQFGLTTNANLPFPHKGADGLASVYLNSLEEVLSLWRVSNREWAYNFPKDVPPDVETNWEAEIDREHWQRLTRVAAFIHDVWNPPDKSPPQLLSLVFGGILGEGQPASARLALVEKIWPACAAVAQHFGREWIFGSGQLAAEREQQLLDLCAEAGQPEKGQQLLAQLSPRTPAAATAVPARPATSPTRLPEMEIVSAPAWLKESHQIFSMFQLFPPNALPPEVHPNWKEFPFPAHFEVQTVGPFAFLGDKLLMQAVDERLNTSGESRPDVADENAARRGRLWILGASDNSPALFEPELLKESVESFFPMEDKIWIAGKSTGYLDLAHRTFRKFSLDDGLPAIETFGIGAAGENVFACGDSFNVFRFEPATSHWTEMPKPTGPFGWSGGETFLLTANRQWLSFTRKDSTALIYDLTAGAWQNLSQLGGFQCAAADGDNFWFGSRDGLGEYNPASKSFKRWNAPVFIQGAMISLVGNSFFGNATIMRSELDKLDGQLQGSIRRLVAEREKIHAAKMETRKSVDPFKFDWRIPGEITALADDGDFLWLGAGNYFGNYLLLLHKPSESLVACFVMPPRDRISSLAVSEKFVWIGTAFGDHKLIQMPRDAFLSVPQDHWVKLAISLDERTRLVAGMNARDQAMYAFHAGDDAKVVSLLENLDPQKASFEEMFLLLFSNDARGVDKPDAMQTWADRIGARFPESPWAKVAQAAVLENREPHKTRKQQAALMAKYDLNHDGILDAEEKAAMEKDPAYQQSEQDWREIQLYSQVREILKEFDHNGDGKLDRSELESLRAQVVLFADAAPETLPKKNFAIRPLLTKKFPSVAAILEKYDPNKIGGLDLVGLKSLAHDTQKK